MQLSTPIPSSICSDTKLVKVECKVVSDEKGMLWSINSRLSQASVDFTTFHDKSNVVVGREGYATATIKELSYNSLSTILTINVDQEEVPYRIRCSDPFSDAFQEVWVPIRSKI